MAVPTPGPHTYRFELYALDTELAPSGSADADDLRVAMDGHVLAEALLEGTYSP